MPLTEIILTTITERVFSYALDQGQSIVEDWVRKKLNLDPKQQAFKRALNKAYKKFEKKYPQWTYDLFNASFLENEGARILSQILIRDGHPDPSELATRWAESLNIRNPERRTTLVRELEPAVSDFLDYLASELKKEPELSDLNDSRTFEQLASDLKAIRYKLGAEQATSGTRSDYLHWLIERNLYLDPRGTFQTQRQVQVKLDEVYISLRAQRDKALSEVDRRLLKQEMAKLEGKIVAGNLSTEAIEDQQEHVLTHIESRFLDTKNAPGEIVELADAIKRHERLVILGDPGSGKSTLLRYLALIYAQALYDGRSEAGSSLGSARFPILIRIADYAEHGMPKGKSLSQYLADYYEMHECPKFGLSDLLATELMIGNCLVLLDGLDEIVNADDRRKVVERIQDFIRYHDNRPNRFVITSRIAGYRSAPLGDPFVQYTVQEMDDTQIHRFLERWCTAVEAAQTPELSQEARDVVARREIDGIMKAVQISPGVHQLAANPLLLRTLALIHRTGAQLPKKRIELYKLAADTLARTWRMAQGVPESALVGDKYLTRLLGRLAYWLHENKSTGIATEQEVYRELGQEWARIKGFDWDEDNPDIESEVKRFLQAVREHTGLFVERAPKRYGFMHLTFEEYYTARHLVARSRDRASLIRKHLHKPRWEEPILLALGFVGLDSPEDAADLLETAILAESEEAKQLKFTPDQYEELLGRDYLFALRCLGDNIPTRPKVLKKLVKRLADELLYQKGSATYSRYRQALYEKLEYLKGSEGALSLNPFIIDALHDADADADVRYWAVQSLGSLAQSSPETLFALTAALHDTDAGVRFNAVQSLGSLAQSSPEVISALINALHDTDANLRYSAAQSLGSLAQSSPEVISALINALQDVELSVRVSAVQSLGQLGHAPPEIISAHINALRDSNFNVRDSAVQSLGSLAQSSPEVISALINTLRDSNSNVREGVVESLGQLDRKIIPDVAIAALLNTLQDKVSRVRLAAATSLRQLEQEQTSKEVVAALYKMLYDKNAGVRRSAAESLLLLGQTSSEAIDIQLEALRKAKNWGLRENSAMLLGKIGQSDELTVKALLDGLLDKDNDVRTACALALAQLGQRFPTTADTIENIFLQAIENPKFDKLDSFERRSSHDYAYDGLWLLVVGGELQGD